MDLESIYRQTGGLPPSAFQHEFATTSYVEHDFLQHDLNEYLFDLVENHDYSGDNSGTLYSRHNELDVSQQEEHLPDYCFSRELELGYVADSSDEPESFPLENPTGMLAEVPLDAVNGQLEQPVTPPRQSRNTSKRLQQEAKRLLETHFEKQPYPEKHEMMSMAQKTKLKLKQVKT
ncbi:hypothetical protein EJ08DRAFT_110306 [Tothia fuscella]|uniref:Homeobox domain-containing protein n=1 Tax=Tothia fuscella TaxID=1048955 RepID=A0A9P4U176_9PEZI|nr:hypothetical protein EJ08DRAFT_110306 [Tothia fuscella]